MLCLLYYDISMGQNPYLISRFYCLFIHVVCMVVMLVSLYKALSAPLELELQTVVSSHENPASWESTPGPLEEQSVLFTSKPSLQPEQSSSGDTLALDFMVLMTQISLGVSRIFCHSLSLMMNPVQHHNTTSDLFRDIFTYIRRASSSLLTLGDL